LFDIDDGIKMTAQTACHGLSLGRMAVARPWIFAQWTKGMEPGPDIHHTTALRLTHLLSRHYDDRFAVKMFKKFAPYFCANFKFSNAILKQLIKAETIAHIRTNIDFLMKNSPETLKTPNLTLFV
ncbi:MAG: tRNA-dihydrouridine synthase, partial [Proteobacteria bacterium]|nr:tRNA-dihydrouridine synthase [Pseudomonadota bacterium]